MTLVATNYCASLLRGHLGRLDRARTSGDYRMVWYVVAAIILFSLAATILLGAIIYCDLKGMRFGAVRQADPFTWHVGCW
jgi:hypothetical protein